MPDLITDKKEIAKKVKEYLKEGSIVELMDFCRKNCPETHRHTNFVRDVAYLMRRSGDFEISVKNENDDLTCSILVWPVPHRSWTVRYPLLFAVLMAFIGAGLALLGEWQLSKQTGQDQHQLDSRQDTSIQVLSDSVANLQKQVRDFENFSGVTDTPKRGH